jgi:hypothetical protein
LFVTDYTTRSSSDGGLVEVRIRTSQQKINESMEYLFSRLTEFETGNGEDDFAPTAPLEDLKPTQSLGQLFVLLRNVRTCPDGTVFCSLEHVTRVPSFCWDVKELIQRKEAGVGDQTIEAGAVDGISAGNSDSCGFGFGDKIPSQWEDIIDKKEDDISKERVLCDKNLKQNNHGCVDVGSQIQFEFVDDTQFTDEENLTPLEAQKDTQHSDEMSQLYPRKLKFESNPLKDRKRKKLQD